MGGADAEADTDGAAEGAEDDGFDDELEADVSSAGADGAADALTNRYAKVTTAPPGIQRVVFTGIDGSEESQQAAWAIIARYRESAQTAFLDAYRAAAAGLPAGSWVMDPTPIPGRWMVYMGRFEDQETLDRKRAELRARKVDHDRAGGTLELGLSLGRFTTKDAAERELANLGTKGVRTARVVQERPDAPGFTLRLPAVNDALRPQLDALRSAMAGKTLRSCT